jgi:uncharacterized OB-fold protein
MTENVTPDDPTTLWYQRCSWCGTPAFRRLLCPACAGVELVHEPSAGRGTVIRATRRPTDTGEQVIALVHMPEGFRLQGVVNAGSHQVYPGITVRVIDSEPAPSFDLDDARTESAPEHTISRRAPDMARISHH